MLFRSPNVTLHFRSDPGFQQIYPATQSPIQSGHVSTLFKVLDDPVPNYVQKLNVRDLGLMDEQKLTEVRPEPSDASSKELELDKTPFLNLGSLLWKERTSSDSVRIRCAFISPALEEQRRLLGADYLGFGGGQGIKIWLNGKPLFSSRSGFPTSRLIQGLVPLPKSLAATDHIELLVCSSGSSPFWGVAVSLWKEKEIRSRCDKKNQWMKSSSAEREDWAFYGMQAQTCIGPMVAPRPKKFSSKHGGMARDSVKLGTE